MDNAVTAGRYGHVDLVGVERRAVDQERYVRKRRRIVLSDNFTDFIKVEVAVYALFVAEYPRCRVFVIADDERAVRVERVRVVYQFAEDDVAVMVYRDSYRCVVLNEIVNTVKLLQSVDSARDTAEVDNAEAVCRISVINIVSVVRIAPQTEYDAGDRNDLAGGLVYVVVDLQDLDLSHLAERDLGVILMVQRRIGKLGIVSEFNGIKQEYIIIRDRIRSFAFKSVRRFHIDYRRKRT